MNEAEKPKRRLGLRFTIRDLIWLTLVVALAVAWWMDRRQAVQYLLHAAQEIRRLTEQNYYLDAMLQVERAQAAQLREEARFNEQ